MPTKQLFNQFADIPALEGEKQKVKEIFGEIKASIIELSSLGLKLDSSKGINEIAKAQQQVAKQQQVILLNEKKLEESEARIAKLQAEAAAKQEQADAIRTKNLINQNKELDRQNQLEQKNKEIASAPNSASTAPGTTSIPGVHNVTQERADYVQSVPFTSNLDEIKAEIEAMQTLETAVSEYDIEQANATNEATQFTDRLKEQAVIMSEVATETENIQLKYDQFTGSMAQNIAALYENKAALEANKSQQKIIVEEIEKESVATDKQISALQKLRTEAALLSNANKQLNQSINLQAKEFNAESGSVEEMTAQLQLLRSTYLSLGESGKASPIGQSMNKEVNELDKAVKDAESNVGVFNRNVGGYFADIEKAGTKLMNFITRDLFRSFASFLVFQFAFNGLIELVNDLSDAFSNTSEKEADLATDLDGLAKSADEAKKEIADLNKYLDNVQKQGKINIQIDTENSPQVDKMKGTLDDLRATSIETGKQVDQLSVKYKAMTEASAKALEDFRNNLSDSKGFGPNATSEREAFESAGGVESLFYDKLSKGSKAAYDAYKKLEADRIALGDAGVQKANDQNYLYRQIALQKVEIAKEEATQERNLALATAQAVADIEKSKADAVLNNDRSSYKQRLTALRQYHNAEVSAISAQNTSVQSNPEASTQEKAAATRKANAELFASREQYVQRTYQLQEEFRLRDAKADTDYHNAFLRDDQAFQDKLVANTIGSIETRSNALDSFAKDQLAAARANYSLQLQQSGFSKKEADTFIDTGKASLDNKKITQSELLAMQRDYESQSLQISRDVENKRTQIIEDEIKKQDALRAESIQRIQRVYSSKSLDLSGQYSDEIIALNNANASKQLSNEQYDRQRRAIEFKYKQDNIQATIDEVEEELSAYDGSTQRLIGAETKLFNDREKLRKLEKTKENQFLIDRLEKEIAVDQAEYDSAAKTVDAKIKLLDKLKKAQGEQSDNQNKNTNDLNKDDQQDSLDILEGSSKTIGGITDLSDAIHDKKIQQYEDQKKVLEDRYQTEVDYINKVYANSIDKQARLDEANKRYSASKAQLDAKEREEQLKKARFDKANSIMQIIIGTATAIIRDLGNPLKIAFDATLGAIQLAIATAAPLPSYYKGTQSSVAGKAMVAEQGRELGIEPSGRVILWEKPQITTLVAGTKIFPNKVTEDMLAANRNMMSVNTTKLEVVHAGHDEEILDELKTLNSKPPIIINVDYNLTTTAYYQNQIKR